MKIRLALLVLCWLFNAAFCAAQSSCDVLEVRPAPPIVLWSPDSSKYFINVQDTAGVYQIYVGNAGDTVPVDISSAYTSGNCCGLFRAWSTRNKMQVMWHPSGDFIICAVEKELYQELFYIPYYPLRIGWLQCGLWTDIWAVKPDGSQWYLLAGTVNGMTGPAFTPDGSKCAWAEALDTGNIFVERFGNWRLMLSEFAVNGGTPSFTSTTNINPAGSRWIEPGNFSPDGKTLLISSDIGMTNAEGQDQFTLDITNGNVVNLNNSPMVWDEHGVFSPDGNKILFMSSYPYRADTNSYHTVSIKTEFMLMDKDGSNLQQLTHFCDSGYIESGGGIAAIGFFGDSVINVISLVFPDYNYWTIKFQGNCGNEAATGIKEMENQKIKIFPTPAQELIYIETENKLSNAIFTLRNVLGQSLKTVRQGESEGLIDIRDLEAGVYFLEVKTDTYTAGSLFIKNK